MAEQPDKPDLAKASPPRPIFRFLVEYFWLLAIPAMSALGVLVIRYTNSYNLDWIPLPGLFKVGIAVGIFALLMMIPYLAFRGEFDKAREDNALQRDARLSVKDAKRRMRLYGGTLSAGPKGQMEAAIAQVERSLSGSPDLGQAVGDLEGLMEEHLSAARKGPAREYAESIGVAVFIALLLRAFVVEAFKIPSGSMIPTLQVGDHIFVNKFIYGVRIPFTNLKIGDAIRPPKRGEVVVFVYPREPEKDFIKRIVAVSGDTIDIKGGQVYINGKALPREKQGGVCEYEDFEEGSGEWRREPCDGFTEINDELQYTTISNPARIGGTLGQQTFPLTVPPRSVFVMGDNRDNSHDSRYWGFVPYDMIKGKALIIWWSSGKGGAVRLERMFHLIH